MEIKPSSIARAASFVSHPQQLPDIDYTVDKPTAQAQVGTETKHDNSVFKPSAQFQTGTNTKNDLKRSIKPPTKLDLLQTHTKA